MAGMVILAQDPLQGLYLEDAADLCARLDRQIGDVRKIVKIKEAEDVSDQVYKIKSLLLELHEMSLDAVLDGIMVPRDIMEGLDHESVAIKDLIDECDRLLSKMKKRGIKWVPQHAVFLASVQSVWEEFAIEMGNRERMALNTKLRTHRDSLERVLIVFRRAIKDSQRAEIDRKVQEKLDQFGVNEKLHYLEQHMRKLEVDHKKILRPAIMAAPAGFMQPQLVDATPPMIMPTQVMPATPYMTVAEPEEFSPHMPPLRPPTAPPAPNMMQMAGRHALTHSEIFARPAGMPPSEHEVKLFEKEFDSDIFVKIYHSKLDSHVRIMVFEDRGFHHLATIWVTTLALRRAGNVILLTNHVTSELWLKLAFQSYKELATFFLYIQAVRIMDYKIYDSTRPLEKIEGEELLADTIIISEEDNTSRRLQLLHDTADGGSNLLRIQSTHEDEVALWTAFLGPDDGATYSALPPRVHFQPQPPHMPHHPAYLPVVWVESAEKWWLGLDAEERLRRTRCQRSPAGWHGVPLKFRSNNDAQQFTKQLTYLLSRGAGVERPMAGTVEATRGMGEQMWGTPASLY